MHGQPDRVAASVGPGDAVALARRNQKVIAAPEPARFGFAYGTLPGHVESGEERFLVEWDRESNRVSYDIVAFSKPNHWLTRLGYPLVRRTQKRFGRESAAAMFRAVNPQAPVPGIRQVTERPHSG